MVQSATGFAYQIEFMVGRRSRDRVISAVETTGKLINTGMLNQFKEASQKRREVFNKIKQEQEQEMDASLQRLERHRQRQADKMVQGQKSAFAAMEAVQKKASPEDFDKRHKVTPTLKKEAKVVKEVLNEMERAVNKFISRTAGFKGVEGLAGAITTFRGQGPSQREEAIQAQEDLLATMKEGSLEYIAHEQLLKKLKDARKEETYATQRYAQEVGKATQTIREGNTIMEQGDKEHAKYLAAQGRNVEEYAEQWNNLGQTFKGTLKNIFVVGTAAIAALNYQLSGVVHTFRDFEQELINANSIWQESNRTLFEISDSVVAFGLKFGVEMKNATSGLYQYASAGVEAAQAMEMLTHTLKLSMAVQGDHNTLSKLTTQTIMGFNMEFSQAEEVTDKFAHAINKSLIEWDDLASSIKFALPFFISTGQSIDQLLGGLQVLTNRALEAGIAGRGLRQALAEFTQHADDNSAAFRKLGIEILDMEGNMKPLNVIAQAFNDTLGEGASDMEVMMTLMEDLNVRGATAFVHLAQNADEFTAAVHDLQNSAGSAAQMAEIQQTSLANQIEVVKTALKAPFLLSDAVGEQEGYLNTFAMEMHGIVDIVENLFVELLPDGTAQLTEMGETVRDFVIGAMRSLAEVLVIFVDIVKDLSAQGGNMTGILYALAAPLVMVSKAVKHLGAEFIEIIIMWKVMNKLIPLNTVALMTNIHAQMIQIEATAAAVAAAQNEIAADKIRTFSKMELTAATFRLVAAQMISQLAMFGAIYLTQKLAKDSHLLAGVFGALAGAIYAMAIAWQVLQTTIFTGGVGFWLAVAGGAAAGAAFNLLMQDMMSAPAGFVAEPQFDEVPSWDTGGRFMSRRMYDMGGYTSEHGLAMLQKGETIIPKTQNMLDGSQGITLNIHGDVYDGDNFAQKVSEVLPLALRNTNDIGGI